MYNTQTKSQQMAMSKIKYVLRTPKISRKSLELIMDNGIKYSVKNQARPNLIKFRRKKENKSTRNKIKVILQNVDNEERKKKLHRPGLEPKYLGLLV